MVKGSVNSKSATNFGNHILSGFNVFNISLDNLFIILFRSSGRVLPPLAAGRSPSDELLF